jgi:hypothetical protein
MSIYIASSDKWSRSYDLWKSEGADEIHFWTEQDILTNLEFEPTSNGKLEEP